MLSGSTRCRAVLALMAMISVCSWDTGKGAVSVGSTAPDFTVVNHGTSQPLHLYSYQGKIIVLDFWAYWCGYCQTAAADLEPNIVQYYRTNGGNANGVPVEVISISVDQSNPTAENSFIASYGLELVADDMTLSAYSAYGNGSIPYLVVINGTTNSTNCRAWQVLYSTAGYSRAGIRSAVDSVQTTAPSISISSPVNGALVVPPDVPLACAVVNRGKILKRVEFYDHGVLAGSVTNPPYNFTWHNAPLGLRSVAARAIYGTTAWVESDPVEFTVGAPSPIVINASRLGTNLVLIWSGSPGLFRVQMARDFTSPVWEYVTASGTNTTCTLSATNGVALYRVVRP